MVNNCSYEATWKLRRRKYGNKVFPSKTEKSNFPNKTGRFGVSGFRKHLKEVYGKDLTSFRVRKKCR